MFGMSHIFVDELHIAGERVPSGLYREIGTGREVLLEEEGVLPASMDGRVAAYICVRYTWRQHSQSPIEASHAHTH